MVLLNKKKKYNESDNSAKVFGFFSLSPFFSFWDITKECITWPINWVRKNDVRHCSRIPKTKSKGERLTTGGNLFCCLIFFTTKVQRNVARNTDGNSRNWAYFQIREMTLAFGIQQRFIFYYKRRCVCVWNNFSVLHSRGTN